MKGISLPHSSYCSFTAIDDHRALVFGGNVAGRRVDNLYLIDFNIMVSMVVVIVSMFVLMDSFYFW